MKHSTMRALTAFSAIALVAGPIQPASASAVTVAQTKKPAAPAIASITETSQTAKGKKKFATRRCRALTFGSPSAISSKYTLL